MDHYGQSAQMIVKLKVMILKVKLILLIKIGKNTDDHRHACLVTWDELDELSERENNITGGNVDYKQFDRDNILAMVELLKH